MDAETLYELLKNEDDNFDKAIICHQYGVAMGDTDLMDLSIWAIRAEVVGNSAKDSCAMSMQLAFPTQVASQKEESEFLERVSQCLVRKCNTEEKDAALWATYYLASADMVNIKKMTPPLERIVEHANSPSLRCLVVWTLMSCYSRANQIHDATRLYETQLDETEARRLKRGKIYALFDLWEALFASDWILDELDSMGHDDPIAKCLWLFSMGEIAYIMRDSSRCLNFHQQAIAEVERIEPRQSVRDLSGVPDICCIESRSEGFVKFIKARARTNVDYAIKDELPTDGISIPALSTESIYKVASPYILGVLCATQIPLFVVLRQEKDLFNRTIIQHQCEIAGENVSPTSPDENNCEIELLHEKIVRCLVEKCKIGAEESEAWAFYYIGRLTQDSDASLKNLKQSLEYGKSPALRYLASMECLWIVTQGDERLRYKLEGVKAAEALGIPTRIRALYDLWQEYEALAMFNEAQETQQKLGEIPTDLAKGLSLTCQAKLEYVMGDYKRCIELHNKAIPTLEKVHMMKEFGIIVTKALFTTLVADKIVEAKVWILQSQQMLGEDNEEEYEARKRRFEEKIMGLVDPNEDLHEVYGMEFLLGKASNLRINIWEAKANLEKILDFSADRAECRLACRKALALLYRIACATQNKEEMESLLMAIENRQTHHETVRSTAKARAEAYFLMGEYDKAIDDQKLVLAMDMDVANRSDSSTLRIKYIDFCKNAFRDMQSYILGANPRTPDVISKALVWAERERARDFLYTIQQQARDSSLSNMADFDRNDDEALSEIRSISTDAGKETVFFVYSKQRKGLTFEDRPVTLYAYFLRAEEDPSWHIISVEDHEDGKWSSDLRKLYRIFVEPLEEMLNKAETKRIVFVTTEETALIPFAALIDDDGKYLIEKYEISTIASLRLFKHCQMQRQYLMKKGECIEALVVANPQLNLPYAEKEGEFVANTLKKMGLTPSLLKGDASTKANVLSKLPHSYWIHMSCHATIDDKIPSGALKLRSQLCDMVCNFGALELANVMPSYVDSERVIKNAKTTRKNLLTAEEIHETHLRAFVTVLGACSSGKGQLCAEGTLGLARSFHLAGVPTVVAALWDVDDEPTCVLMERFYANMSTGLSVASALRNAMISMIREMDGQTNQPPKYEPHWASFFISGCPFSSLIDIPSSSFPSYDFHAS